MRCTFNPQTGELKFGKYEYDPKVTLTDEQIAQMMPDENLERLTQIESGHVPQDYNGDMPVSLTMKLLVGDWAHQP